MQSKSTTSDRISRVKDAQQVVEIDLSLLAEYRTRLIADVVTGKLDVREAAATLPEEPGDPDAVEAYCRRAGRKRRRPPLAATRGQQVPATQEEMTS